MEEELKKRLSLLTMPTNVHPFWKACRTQLKLWLLQNGFDSFRECPIIKQTMDVGAAEYTYDEFEELPEKFYDYLENTYDDDDEMWKIRGNSIHHCYHIHKWESFSQKEIQNCKSIIEVGAGFGETCRIIHQLGFKGKYYIYDFPEFAILQEYYLRKNNVDISNVVWINSIPITQSFDMLIAEWSLSEMPDAERNLWLEVNFDKCLLAYSKEFMGQDNHLFFSKMGDKVKYNKYETISHLDNKHAYIFGDNT